MEQARIYTVLEVHPGMAPILNVTATYVAAATSQDAEREWWAACSGFQSAPRAYIGTDEAMQEDESCGRNTRVKRAGMDSTVTEGELTKWESAMCRPSYDDGGTFPAIYRKVELAQAREAA